MLARTMVRSIASYKMNPVIKLLILSDFIIWTAYQVIAPIFALFVTNELSNGSIEAVGIASAVYLLSKSLFEIPVGIVVDKWKGEKDDLLFAVVGVLLGALAYILMAFAASVWHMYLLQGLMGIGAAIAYPGWYALFSHHIDRGKEGFEWSLYDVLLGVGMAASAAVGGFFANEYGFDLLFIVVGVLAMVGGLLLIPAYKDIKK